MVKRATKGKLLKGRPKQTGRRRNLKREAEDAAIRRDIACTLGLSLEMKLSPTEREALRKVSHAIIPKSNPISVMEGVFEAYVPRGEWHGERWEPNVNYEKELKAKKERCLKRVYTILQNL